MLHKEHLSGKYLDIYKAKADNGWKRSRTEATGGNNQKFKLVSDGNGYYTIYTGASNYKSCLRIHWSRDNGANINQWRYHGGDCQKFQLKISDNLCYQDKDLRLLLMP
ncbi:MAG: RICIN domain-containing protein [Ruminococcus bicirculans (ex Wegman et al. 2014)]